MKTPMKKSRPGPAADRPATAVDSAVKRLRRAVMYGQFLPGQKLMEASLCKELGISRPSLREALRVLETEGLIELVPNYGPRVARLDERDVEEIQEVWSLLTGRAAFLFARIADAQDMAALETAYDNGQHIIRSGTSMELLTASNDFFQAMVSRCGNKTLYDVITRLASRVNFLRSQVLLHHRVQDQYAQELSEIMQALRTRTPAAARRAVERHIAWVCHCAARMLTPVVPHEDFALSL